MSPTADTAAEAFLVCPVGTWPTAEVPRGNSLFPEVQ